MKNGITIFCFSPIFMTKPAVYNVKMCVRFKFALTLPVHRNIIGGLAEKQGILYAIRKSRVNLIENKFNRYIDIFYTLMSGPQIQ